MLSKNNTYIYDNAVLINVVIPSEEKRELNGSEGQWCSDEDDAFMC